MAADDTLYGTLHLPVPVPEDGQAPGDPLLDILLAFCKAVINDAGGAAWRKIAASDKQLPVMQTYAWDPLRGGIAKQNLPALFLFRSFNEPSDWVAHDYFVRPSQLTMYWVPPPVAKQELRGRQSAFFNVIQSAVDSVIDPEARDPSFVVPGDTDPRAADEGSLLWRFAKVWELDAGRSEWVELKIPVDSQGMEQGTPSAIIFPAVRTYFLLRERNESPASRNPQLDAVEGQLFPAGDFPYTQFLLKLTLSSISPNTGPVAGGTGVAIHGTGFPVDPSEPPTVTIGGAAATDVLVSAPGVLTCTTPPGTAGAKNVVVTKKNGESATLTAAFTYV